MRLASLHHDRPSSEAAATLLARLEANVDRAGDMFVRLLIDLALVVVIGTIVFGVKRLMVHRRDPLS